MFRGSGTREGRKPLAVFLAILIGVAGLVVVNPAARAAEVNAIDPGSIRVTKTDQGDSTIYMYSNVRVDANWSIPDGTGHAGDTFKIGLPEELGGIAGSFELKGKEGDPLTYGTCQVARAKVVCTLNANVEGKNNVGGSLWVKTQVIALTTASKLSFEVSNGTKVEVPLPDGQQGIGYKPYVPAEIDKSGWFPGADQSTIHWRIVIPGDKISDRSSVTITDDYLQAGSNLTVSAGYPKIFWIPSTPKCWNELESAECRNDLSGSSVPSSTVTIDDDKDQVKAVLDNKGQNFQADRIYVFDLELTTDGEIPVGSQYVNRGFVDGEKRTARAEKTSSGGGTGSGDTVGHVSVKKAVTNGNVPGDTVFPVTWSYQYKGATRTGELSVRADGTVETLNNVPNGVVVTLTEKVPVVAGFDFGDPVFSGAGVSDGVPDANSARVRVEGLKTAEVTLTNPVTPVVKPVLSRVDVTPGVCAPGASEPSEPTVEVGPTDGITYSAPEFTKVGDQVTVKLTAKPAAGKEIDDQNLPAGWVANGDGTFTFTTTVTQPVCEKVVTPVVPIVDPGVCPVDSTTPTQPTVTGVEDTEQIDYSEPVVVVNGDQVTVTVTAAAKPGYRIDTTNLPEGWAVVGGVVTYTTTVTQPKCVTPVAPRIDVGVCPADSLTPTPPSAAFDPVEGLEFSEPRVEVRDGKVTVTATVTAKAGFQIGGPLPEGWTRVNEITAKFTTTKDQPVCQPKKVAPVTPKITVTACAPGSTTPTPPVVENPEVTGLTYGAPKITVEGGKATITITVTPETGYSVKETDLPEGWRINDDGTATYTTEVDPPDCATPTPTVSPTPGVTKPPAPVRPGLPRTGV